MTPIDVHHKDVIPGEDPVEMLRAMTMAFMILLSRQPHMSFAIDYDTMTSFPYSHYNLEACSDPVTKQQTFILTAAEKGAVN